MRPLLRRARTSSVLRYAIIGGLTFVVDLALLVLLHGMLEVPVAPATALAYAGAIAFNFSTNSRWTFAGGAHGAGFARYMVVIVANLVATVVLVELLVRLGLHYTLAKTATTAAATLWTYPVSRRWVFRD